jgi:hypothetical protein
MNTYAKCRDYNEGESFPYLELKDAENVHYWPCDETEYLCFQPDYLDDEEFNIIIIFRHRPVFARGIHFDFIDK